MTFRREDYDDLDMWWGWEKGGFLWKCYTQKWRENDQEEDPDPDYLPLSG